MGNLFYFFIRFGAFLLFLLLEGISFYLVVQYNNEQGKIYSSSAYRISSMMSEKYDDLVSFISLREVADSLSKENARLRSRLLEAKYSNLVSLDTLLVEQDSLEQQFLFIEAKIISNSINRNNNVIRINKGTNHGVEAHSGVVTDEGIVGIVRYVTSHYAQVMPLLHRQARISAAIKRNKFFGSLRWEDNDPSIMVLEDIQKHAEIQRGDTIETSGYSSIFPPGVMIGVVDEFNIRQGSNYYNIKVKLNTDFSNLQYVYVAKNLIRDEISELQEKTLHE